MPAALQNEKNEHTQGVVSERWLCFCIENLRLRGHRLKCSSSVVHLPMAPEDASFTFPSIGIITHGATSAVSPRVVAIVHLLPMTSKDASFTFAFVGIITHRTTSAVSPRWIPPIAWPLRRVEGIVRGTRYIHSFTNVCD